MAGNNLITLDMRSKSKDKASLQLSTCAICTANYFSVLALLYSTFSIDGGGDTRAYYEGALH